VRIPHVALTLRLPRSPGIGEEEHVHSQDEKRFIPGLRPTADPQAELVRRYARILRSAPAEAWKPRVTRPDGAMTAPRFGRKRDTAAPEI
jgi:hypothetical protein